VAVGRLVTDYCNGCSQSKLCGEGMYALRIGVDGIFKPCLMRHDRFTTMDHGRPLSPLQLQPLQQLQRQSTAAPITSPTPASTPTSTLPVVSSSGHGSVVNRAAALPPSISYGMQILRQIDDMVGTWSNAHYSMGAPA
jgi:hypothetical protein